MVGVDMTMPLLVIKHRSDIYILSDCDISW